MIMRIDKPIRYLDKRQAYVISDKHHCGTTFVWMDDLDMWVIANIESSTVTLVGDEYFLQAVPVPAAAYSDSQESALADALGQDVESLIKVVKKEKCPVMTFEQFQATKKFLRGDEFVEATSVAVAPDDNDQLSGNVYLDSSLHIESTEFYKEWKSKHPRRRWYLMLGRCDWLSDDLEELERRLYQWALDEQYIRNA